MAPIRRSSTYLGEDERLMATLQRGDNAHSRDEGLIEIYKRQKPGEPPTRGERAEPVQLALL